MEVLFALLAALLAGLSFVQVLGAEARAGRARARARAADEEAERLARRIRALQREVETLSAIREVALIANGDVSFERILTEVLKIVEDLIEATEVSIWVRDEAGGELRPRAVRRGGAARFEGLEGEDRSLAGAAFQARRTLRRIERGEAAVATLLYADAEVAGVLAARGPVAGRTEEDLAAVEAALEAVAKHVALAVRKPTLYDRAVTDALTQLYTKRHFQSQLARHCAASRRTGRPFALVLCDVDHFKRVNDTHGHLAGDLVLSEVAAAIRATIRESDSAYRYGGEEMAVIAPEAGAEEGRALAERLRAAVEGRPFCTPKGDALRVTASFGVAAFGGALCAPEALVAAADGALYAAKEAGRNRVRVHGDGPGARQGEAAASPSSREPQAPGKRRARGRV